MAKKIKTAHYRIHQMRVADFERNFPNEDACKAYLTHHRSLENEKQREAQSTISATAERAQGESPIASDFYRR